MLIARIVVASLLAAFSAFPAFACDDDDSDGLDVGLVLSGGGAFASTHVGALQIIEELDVPIHCVVGTSMGSVVGGLYASGYDSHELEDIFLQNDWGPILRGDVNRIDRSYLQKEREDEYFTDYLAGVGNGLRLPGGVISMQGLRGFYRSLLFHIPIDEDFDQLRVPYRAVATDLSTGAAIAFEDGDIVEAMLASMAVPGAFAPREIGGRLYVDGGLSQQLPVEAARELGADIIIAIDTTVAAPEIGPGASVAAVTQQLITLNVERNWRTSVDSLGGNDIMIRPSLEGLNVSAFENAETGIAAGRREANLYLAELETIRSLAAPARDIDIPRDTNIDPNRPIIVSNTSEIDNALIEGRFGLDETGTLEPHEFDARFRDLLIFGGFGEVDFAQTKDAYVLSTDPRGLGQNLLQLGLSSSNSFDGDSRFSLRGRISRRPLFARGGEAALALEIGSNVGIGVELYRPIGEDGRFFVEPEIFYYAEEVAFDIGELRVAEFWQKQLGSRIRFGRELGTWGVIAVDAEILDGRLEPQITIIPDFDDPDYAQGGPGVMFGADTLNRSDWPTSGFRTRLRAQRLFDFDTDEITDKFFVGGSAAFEAGQTGILLNTRFESVENEENRPVDILQLGGFRRLAAYPEFAIPTNEYGYASIEVFRRLTPSDTVLSLPIYVGVLAEYADARFDFLSPGSSESFTSGGIYIGADTPFGPLFLGGAVGEDDTSALYFHIGQRF
jgi:NTE family protein